MLIPFGRVRVFVTGTRFLNVSSYAKMMVMLRGRAGNSGHGGEGTGGGDDPDRGG